MVDNIPFFSVIVLAYQVQPYIKECLDSILNQSFKNFEIIIVAPSCTDKTEEICEKYFRKYDHISLVKLTNQGQLLNRLAGLKKARGKYLLCIDGDDYWKVNLLKNVYDGLIEQNCDMVIFRYEYTKENEIIPTNSPGFINKAVFEGEEKKKIYSKLIEGKPINEICTKVLSKELFLKINQNFNKYASVRLGEDVIYSMYLADNAERILYLDEALYIYRWRSDSITQIFLPNTLKDKMIVTSVIEEMMAKWEMTEPYYYDLLYQSLAGFFANYIFRCSISVLSYHDRKELLFEIKKNEMYKKSRKFYKYEILSKRIKVFVTLFEINPVLLLYFANGYRFAKRMKKVFSRK